MTVIDDRAITPEDPRRMRRQILAKSLKGKTIQEVELREGANEILIVIFDDGTKLTAGTFCRAEENLGWRAWTGVSVNGEFIIKQ